MPSILLSELPNEGISSGSNFIKHFYLQHFVTTLREIFSKCIMSNLIVLYFLLCTKRSFVKECICWVCICVFANKGEVGPSVQCLNSNEWWGGGYPPHPSILLKDRIKKKETILEFVFFLKVDFICNVCDPFGPISNYRRVHKCKSESINNWVEYSVKCIKFPYLWKYFMYVILDLIYNWFDFSQWYFTNGKANFDSTTHWISNKK